MLSSSWISFFLSFNIIFSIFCRKKKETKKVLVAHNNIPTIVRIQNGAKKLPKGRMKLHIFTDALISIQFVFINVQRPT